MIIYVLAASLSNQDIEHQVRKLGPQSDINSVERIAKFGCRAIPFLARELNETVRERVEISPKADSSAMKLVWTIASLRYISGEDFRSGVSYNSSPVGRQLIGKGGPGGKIFAIWQSRGVVFFNSASAQRDVIKKWKVYSNRGSCKPGRVRTDISFVMNGIKD